MIRTTLTSAALVAACLAGWAFADPFTPAPFADLNTTVSELSANPGNLTKKQVKAFKPFVKAFNKPAKSLAKDFGTAAKGAKLAKKFGDNPTMLAAIDKMVGGMNMAVQARFDEVSASVDELTPAKAATKAVKLRDQAQSLLDKANAADTPAKQLKNLKKALSKAEAAAKQVNKANNSGGGGGGKNCEGPPPGVGEMGTLTFGNTTDPANRLGVTRITRGAMNVIESITIIVGDCSGNSFRALEVTISGDPNPGNYNASPGPSGANVGEIVPGGFLVLQGTVTIDSRTGGKITGSFKTRPDITNVRECTFVVNDPDAP